MIICRQFKNQDASRKHQNISADFGHPDVEVVGLKQRRGNFQSTTKWRNGIFEPTFKSNFNFQSSNFILKWKDQTRRWWSPALHVRSTFSLAYPHILGQWDGWRWSYEYFLQLESKFRLWQSSCPSLSFVITIQSKLVTRGSRYLVWESATSFICVTMSSDHSNFLESVCVFFIRMINQTKLWRLKMVLDWNKARNNLGE